MNRDVYNTLGRVRPHNFIDLKGRTFGKWTVVCRSSRVVNGARAYWRCRCECGAKGIVNGCELTLGRSRGCRMCMLPSPIKPGDKFGLLTVLKFEYTSADRIWSCRCKCGNIALVRSPSLKRGLTRSCGCLRYRPDLRKLLAGKKA